jgi:hypothetical protein
MMAAEEVQRLARRRYAAISRKRRDPRYRRVLGRLVAAGLLSTTEPVKANRAVLKVEDVLWAAEIEPRMFELLPALIIKRPALFRSTTDLPDDLAAVVVALRRNRTPDSFHGIPGEAMKRWVSRVGHKNKLPSQLRSFRLQADEVALLERLSERWGISQTAVIRRALREADAAEAKVASPVARAER